MTCIDTKKLRELHSKATQGEWFVDATKATGAYGIYQSKHADDKTEGLTMVCRAGYSVYITPIEQRNADMSIIVAMHESLPALLDAYDEVERLRAALKKITALPNVGLHSAAIAEAALAGKGLKP